eukprot:m.19484 g.19484  ORF g.19484 m.19484 type:complete len:1126 (-) comp8697_c0_seq1:567-3944(-)
MRRETETAAIGEENISDQQAMGSSESKTKASVSAIQMTEADGQDDAEQQQLTDAFHMQPGRDDQPEESSIIQTLRTVRLPAGPLTGDAGLNPQKAAARRSRIIRGRAQTKDFHQPRRVCVFLCYPQFAAAVEVNIICAHAHVFLREWSLNQFELPVDLIDLHDALTERPVSSDELQQLFLDTLKDMTEREVLPVFVRLSTSPEAIGNYVVPSSLSGSDQSRISNQELVQRFYEVSSNRLSDDPHTVWLKENLTADDRRELLNNLAQSPFKSRLQCMEEEQIKMVLDRFDGSHVVHLQMTNVQGSHSTLVASLAERDTQLRSRAPVLQTAIWDRPADMPYGTEALSYESEAYSLAVAKSYVMCMVHVIQSHLSILQEQDGVLMQEMQDHLALRATLHAASKHLPLGFSEALVKQYILLEKPAPPLILHGSAGSGRTTAATQVAALAADLPTKSHTERVIIPRFGGMTPRSSNLHSFLHDLNRHLCMVYDGDAKRQPSSQADLIRRWTSVLQLASPYLPVVVILDIDSQMLQIDGADAIPIVQWIPPLLPPSVRVIVLTATDEVASLRSKIPESMFRQLGSLTREQAEKSIQQHLQPLQRSLNAKQMAAVLNSVSAEPGIVALTLGLATRSAALWSDPSIVPASDILSMEGAFAVYISLLEQKHTTQVVRTCALVLCLSQEGATDVELSAVLAAAGVSSSMHVWFRLRLDFGSLVQRHSVHHVNTFSSASVKRLFLERYSAADRKVGLDLYIGSLRRLAGEGGSTSHLSLELSHLLERHASQEQIAAALGEPRFFLHFVATAERAGGSHSKQLWSALSDKQKRTVCHAAYRVLMATIPQYRGQQLKKVLDQSSLIASFVDRMNDQQLALDLFNESLRVQEQVLGAEHPFTLSSATKLAGVLYKHKNAKRALEVCQQYTKSFVDPALVPADQAVKPCRIELSGLLLLRSNINLDRNKFAEAKEDLEKVLVIYAMHNITEDSDDVRLAAVWGNLANICAAMDQHQAALDYYRKALSVFRVASTRDVKKVCTTLLNIALAERYLNRHEEALAAAQEARELAEASWGEQHNITLEAVHSCAITLEVMGNYAAALEHYNTASEGYIALSGRPSHAIHSAIKRCEAKVSKISS